MYSITENTLRSILKRKFGSLVGTLCERIEILEKENISKDVLVRLIKNDLKKDAYNTMREIEDQIEAFTKGADINVKLNRPTSSK